MRWIWIDKFLEFESGKRAVSLKNLTQAEEHLHDHFPGYPLMPASLMVEGMAQTAGILVGEDRDFKEKVVLAKIQKAVFDGIAVPGDQLKYEAKIERMDDQGAMTSGTVYRNGEKFGTVDLFFSHVDQNMKGLAFPKENFVFTEEFKSLLRTYTADTQPSEGSEA